MADGFTATYDTDAFYSGTASYSSMGGGAENYKGDEYFALGVQGDTLTLSVPKGALSRRSTYLYSHNIVWLDAPLALQVTTDQPVAWQVSLDMATSSNGGGHIDGSLWIETRDGQQLTLESLQIDYPYGTSTPSTARTLAGLVPAGTDIAKVGVHFDLRSDYFYNENFARIEGSSQASLAAIRIQAMPVPEPAGGFLFLMGGAGLGLLARSRKR